MVKNEVGLMESTDMPHAYIEFTDGTVIAVPLVHSEPYTHVAKIHVTVGDGKTVDVVKLAVQHTTKQAVLARSDVNPALARQGAA